VVIGDSASSSGLGSVCIGLISGATGDFSTAVGRKSTASGNYSSAFGDNTTANAINSTAIGVSAVASGNNSIALGANTNTNSFAGAIALGNGTAANQSGFFVSPVRPDTSLTGNALVYLSGGEIVSRLFSATYGTFPYFQTILLPGTGTYSVGTAVPCGTYTVSLTNGYQSDFAWGIVIYTASDVGAGANPYAQNYTARNCSFGAVRDGPNADFFMQVGGLSGNVYYLQLTPC